MSTTVCVDETWRLNGIRITSDRKRCHLENDDMQIIAHRLTLSVTFGARMEIFKKIFRICTP